MKKLRYLLNRVLCLGGRHKSVILGDDHSLLLGGDYTQFFVCDRCGLLLGFVSLKGNSSKAVKL